MGIPLLLCREPLLQMNNQGVSLTPFVTLILHASMTMYVHYTTFISYESKEEYLQTKNQGMSLTPFCCFDTSSKHDTEYS